jgi:predicted nucleic acid binding AN1-type Zn finger protein
VPRNWIKPWPIANTDYAQLGKAIVEDPEGNVTAKDVSAALRAGVGKTVAEMSAEDQAILMAFSKTAAFRKVRELGPAVQEASAQWSNETSPEDEKRMEEIATKAVEDFMAEADNAKSGKR